MRKGEADKDKSQGNDYVKKITIQGIQAQRRTSKFMNFQKLQQEYDVPVKTKMINQLVNSNQVPLLREESIKAARSQISPQSENEGKDAGQAEINDSLNDLSDIELPDCCDEDIQVHDIERQQSNYSYSEFIRQNPLLIDKGSLSQYHMSSGVKTMKHTEQVNGIQKSSQDIVDDIQNRTTGQDTLLQGPYLHHHTVKVQQIKDDIAEDGQLFQRVYTVNTFDRPQKSLLRQILLREKNNYSPRNNMQTSMGKILSNEDLKYLSIRSETPRLEGASRKNSSKRKLLFEHHQASNLLGDDKNDQSNFLLKPARQPLSGCKSSKSSYLNSNKLSPQVLEGIEEEGAQKEDITKVKRSLTNRKERSPLNKSKTNEHEQAPNLFGNFLEAPAKKGQKQLNSHRRHSGSEIDKNLERKDSEQFRNELEVDQQSQISSRRGGKTSHRTIRKVSNSTSGKKKVVLITKRHISTANTILQDGQGIQAVNQIGLATTNEDDEFVNKKKSLREISGPVNIRIENPLENSQQINIDASDNENNLNLKVSPKKAQKSKRLISQDESQDNGKFLQVASSSRKVRKTISCSTNQRFKSEMVLPDVIEEDMNPSKNPAKKSSGEIVGILKKRSTHLDKSPRNFPSSRQVVQSKPKKTVKFSAKAQIHEYEKLKDISETSSSDQDSECDSLDPGQITEESKQYLYNKKEIELLSQVKKPFHKFIIPPDDPVFKYDYQQIFLKDRDAKKRFYNEFKVCRAYHKKKPRLGFDDRTMKAMLKNCSRKGNVQQYTVRSDGTKKHTRKTIVFDLDNTLVKSAYKKHKLSDYDSYIYVNILGTKRIRLYLSYRPFIREMLEQLRQDFELILYSAQSREYTQKAALLLTINPTESYPCVFHQILCKDECIYMDDIDIHISDLDILTENRNIKDIIMISDSFGRTLKHLRNRVPVKTFQGSKKDYSMVALVRYLKGFIRVKDVREKIQLDFKTIDM